MSGIAPGADAWHAKARRRDAYERDLRRRAEAAEAERDAYIARDKRTRGAMREAIARAEAAEAERDRALDTVHSNFRLYQSAEASKARWRARAEAAEAKLAAAREALGEAQEAVTYRPNDATVNRLILALHRIDRALEVEPPRYYVDADERTGLEVEP